MPRENAVRLEPGVKVRVTTRATDARTGIEWIRSMIEELQLGSWSAEFGLERDLSVGSEVWVEGLVQERMTDEEAEEFGMLTRKNVTSESDDTEVSPLP